MRIFGTIAKELIARVVIITIFYSIISYIIILRHYSTSNNLETAIPLLFVTYGVVILISILYCLRKYHVWSAKK
jgi:hypothetical protein